MTQNGQARVEHARRALARAIGDGARVGTREGAASAGARARARWSMHSERHAQMMERTVEETWVALKGRDEWTGDISGELVNAAAQAMSRLKAAACEEGLDAGTQAGAQGMWRNAVEAFLTAWAEAKLGDGGRTFQRAVECTRECPGILGIGLGRLAALKRLDARDWARIESAAPWMRAEWIRHMAGESPTGDPWGALARRMEAAAAVMGISTRVERARAAAAAQRWRWPQARPPLALLALHEGPIPEDDTGWAALVRLENAPGTITRTLSKAGREGIAAVIAQTRAREPGRVRSEIEARALEWIKNALGRARPAGHAGSDAPAMAARERVEANAERKAAQHIERRNDVGDGIRRTRRRDRGSVMPAGGEPRRGHRRRGGMGGSAVLDRAGRRARSRGDGAGCGPCATHAGDDAGDEGGRERMAMVAQGEERSGE